MEYIVHVQNKIYIYVKKKKTLSSVYTTSDRKWTWQIHLWPWS